MKGFYSEQQIAAMSLFSKLTRVDAKDCFLTDSGFIFVVKEGLAGMAVGKAGSNIKKLEKITKKKVKVVEYSADPCKFVANLIFPIRPKDIVKEDDKIKIIAGDFQSRARLIGRNKKNLNQLLNIFNKYFKESIEIS